MLYELGRHAISRSIGRVEPTYTFQILYGALVGTTWWLEIYIQHITRWWNSMKNGHMSN